MAQRLVFIHALTPLHAGTGQAVGAIDLPIHRERATNIPLLPGSSIRGCLRDSMNGHEREEVLFGSRRGKDDPTAGSLRIGDAHLLLLPVRCLGATFVWAVCPFLLHRLKRSAAAVGWKNLPAIPDLKDGHANVASMDATVKMDATARLVLEDLDFSAESTADAEKWCDWLSDRLFPVNDPWRGELKKRFAIIDDKSFDFLSEFATEISAHIAIDDKTGTVADGALWYQEALPAESILCGVMQADKPRNGAKDLTAEALLDTIAETGAVQFGGKAGTGLGVARFVPAKQ